MTFNNVKFLLNDKIAEIDSPDPNKTILDYIRKDLKKQVPKKDVLKVAVVHVLL